MGLFGAPAPGAPAPATGGGSSTPAPSTGFAFGAAPAGGNTNAAAPGVFETTPAAGAPGPTAGTPAGATNTAPSAAASAFRFGSAPATATGAPAPVTGAPTPPAGGVPTAAPTGGAPTAASAPATSAFNFAATPATATGGFSSTTTPASTTTAGFGASPSATTAPASFAPPTGTTTTASTGQITVQDYDSLYPYMSILSKVSHLVPLVSRTTAQDTLEGQELIHILQCQPSTTDKSVVGHLLSRPPSLAWVNENEPFRAKLQANPTVLLQGKEALLTPEMMQEIWQLADDLRISEESAMSLFAAASDRTLRTMLESRLDGSFVDAATSPNDPAAIAPLELGNNVPKAARELFFYERSCALTVLLLLIQHRINVSSTESNKPKALVVATDQLIQNGLVDNLITLVREYTQLADDLEKERLQKKSNIPQVQMFAGTPTPQSSSDPKSKKKGFATVLLSFVHAQRHLAAECLFYITYHTQCTAHEVASLIDLIKDLTNGKDESGGLPILDPFKDVPSAFVDPNPTPAPTGPWGTPFTAALPPLKEKDPLEWQKELVRTTWEKSGKPQLLKCVGVLVMSVISALDGRHVLMDRNLHGPNELGVGNALLPPGQHTNPDATNQLDPIHSRLDPKTESNQGWKRQDIWGLLISSYALLLLPVELVVASPRHRSRSQSDSPLRSPSGRIDIKLTWRACLEAPTRMKSFSFARLSLVPSFAKRSYSPDGICNNYEFYMSVLSEFMAHYLDVLFASGNFPISREQWKSDEETELQVRRVQRDQQQQFHTWSGASCTEEATIPNEVDLLERPDCMDDVISLAVALCSTGPKYAMNFWSVIDENVTEGEIVTHRPKLVPSRALQTMERLQAKDTSLQPAYVSFLAALALAQAPEENPDCSGASVVHSMLAKDIVSNVNWKSLFVLIRWFARELTSRTTGRTASTETLRSSSVGADSSSTAYYYGADSTEDGMRSNLSQSQQRQSTTTASTDTKPKELGEENTAILLSHLGLVSSVASNSSEARSAISSMKLPVSDGVGEDAVLTVLFSLAIAPLSPEVRGAVFVTISNVLRETSPTVDSKARKDIARKGWDLLEESQVLPIALLDQYAKPTGISGHAVVRMGFPPSSRAQVSTNASEQPGTAWTPPNPKYGIMYEMEHIEARMGVYPSTEGLLHLLTTLCVVGGCPSDLGRFWRARSGCSPYIEYVIHFVLPRALATQKDDRGLPFRTLGDKSRLICLALELVEAVISRYVVPKHSTEVSASSTSQIANDLFGLSSVAEAITIRANDEDEKTFALDYRDDVVSSSPRSVSTNGTSSRLPAGTLMSSSYVPSTVPLSGEGSLPSPKSPGFAVLVDILSSSSGDLFKAVTSILTENFASRGIDAMYGLPEHEAFVASALFGSTPPSFLSVKGSSKRQSFSGTKQSLLISPFPAGAHTVHVSLYGEEHVDSVHGAFWRESSVALALRILCGAAVREENFSRAVNAVRHPLKVVPVLRFHKLTSTHTGVQVLDVQVSRLVDLLNSSGGLWFPREGGCLLPTIVEYIGYVSPSWQQDAKIASPATALMMYVDGILPEKETIRSLCGNSPSGDKMLAAATARRLKTSSQRVEYGPHADIVRVILGSLVSNLRVSSNSDMSVSQVLLGLPTLYSDSNWEGAAVAGSSDSFDVILELLSDMDFIRDNRTSGFAAKCYEILYRLVSTQGIDMAHQLIRVLHASERLRAVDFWYVNLLKFLGRGRSSQSSILDEVATNSFSREEDDDILHCIAWLLKGVSNELRLLMGNAPPLKDGILPAHILSFASPRPILCRRLLSLLFAGPGFLAVHALNDLPLVRGKGISPSALPSTEMTQSEIVALSGPSEVVAGYDIISINKLIQRMGKHGEDQTFTDSQKSALAWANEWNLLVTRDCAVSHFADSLRVLMGSSFVLCRSLLLDGFWDEGAYGRAPLDNRGMVQFLALILTRLTDELPEGSDSRGIDHSLYSHAALHLSTIALLLVHELGSLTESSRLPLENGDAVRIYVLLAQAVALSAKGDGSMTSHQVERTVLLGKSLALVAESLFRDPDGLRSYDGERETFVLAASALAHIACGPVNGSSRTDWTTRGERRSSLVRTTRSCLSTLLSHHEDEATTPEGSFVYILFKKGPRAIDGVASSSLLSFLSLVETLDDDVYTILSKIALCRFGTELLQDAGVGPALVKAAGRYSEEERRAKAHVTAANQDVDIGTPSFLLGHMTLLNTLISAKSLSPENRSKLVVDAEEVIHRHVPAIERLILSFPADGDVTLEVMKCLYLTTKSWDFGDASGSRNLWQIERVKPRLSMAQGGRTVLEKATLALTYHISQHPFPQRFLSLLPRSLCNTESVREPSTHVVSVSKSLSRSWWDVAESEHLNKDRVLLPNPPKVSSPCGFWDSEGPSSSGDPETGNGWSDQHYEMCIQSARILDSSLSFLNQRVLLSPPLPIDCVALAKGFCRCADSARAIEGRLCTLTDATSGSAVTNGVLNMSLMDVDESNNNALVEKEYLAILGPLLGRCAEKFLVLTVSYLRTFAHDSMRHISNESKMSVADLSTTMLATLDHTQVESMGVGCVGFRKGDEKEREFAKEISKNLRKEVQGEMKRFS